MEMKFDVTWEFNELQLHLLDSTASLRGALNIFLVGVSQGVFA